MKTPSAVLLSLLISSAALAEERLDESAMFGAPEVSATGMPSRAADAVPDAEAALGMPERSTTDEQSAENPLTIGGQFYLRSQVTANAHQPPGDWMLTSPMLADGWLDARPNSRVRGQLVARMSYDPTVPATAATSYTGSTRSGGPDVVLDQLWLNFDIGRAVFVTAGRQHVKWGVSRFWNPNDLLHSDRRDALARFDARVGQSMVKVHVPWESLGWNLYALALLENPGQSDTLGSVGGAARVETVFGTAELGLDTLVRKDARSKFGADLSAGLGPIDIHVEAVARKGTDGRRWREIEHPVPFGDTLESYNVQRWTAAASGGIAWAFNMTDKEAMTIGVEYFYNPAGYTKKKIYPWLIYNNEFTPFYVARDYAAAYVFFPVPGTNGNHTITLSNLANVSDKTAIARLDWGASLLTHLRFEAFASGRYGAAGGEFRFGLDLPPTVINGQFIPALSIPPPVAEAGVGLRVNF